MSNVAYQAITQQIIDMIDGLEHDFELPWRKAGFSGLPMNAVSRKPYNGINSIVLSLLGWKHGYETPFWLTFKQAKQLGGSVRKGEKGTKVMFFKILEKENGDEIPMARYYTVFNIAQCEGLQIIGSTERHTTEATNIVEWAQSFARVRFGGDQAFYMPSQHRIQMPHRSQFRSDDGFHATLLHELTHWTMKDLGRDAKSDYAFEELVAELGSVFMCQCFGISYELEHHASYIKIWLKSLKDDPRYIIKAARLAQKAADHLQSFSAAERAA